MTARDVSVRASSPWRAIVLLSAATFAASASLRMCDPLVPELSQFFAISPGRAAQVISAFAIAYGLMQVVFGPLADRYGKFRVVAWATLACSVGTLGAAIAPTFNWLVAARALSGATTAAIMPLGMAWIGDNVAYGERQATIARFLIGQILGLIAGQVAAGIFADTLGWRWAFGTLLGVYLLAALLLHLELLRNPAVDARANMRTQTSESFLRQSASLLTVGWVRVVLLAVFLEAMIVYGAFAFVPYYLHESFGVSIAAAGTILATYGVGGFAFAASAKQLVARFGERGLATGGGLLLGIGFLVLAIGQDWGWAIPAILIAGLGFYMLHNTLQINATQMAPTFRGTAMSTFSAFMFLGQSVGVTLAAFVVDSASPRWLFAIAAVGFPLIGVGFAHAKKRRLAISNIP